MILKKVNLTVRVNLQSRLVNMKDNLNKTKGMALENQSNRMALNTKVFGRTT